MEFPPIIPNTSLFGEIVGINSPLFSPILRSLEEQEYDQEDLDKKIATIFQRIFCVIPAYLSVEQFKEINDACDPSTIEFYKKVDDLAMENQNHALVALAEDISYYIPKIPSDPVEIRAWFANPENQEAIDSVTDVSLDGKGLNCLPHELILLRRLEKLVLSNNQIQTLPDLFGTLISLKHLCIFHNDLTTLPASFTRLTKLEWLNLGSNLLVSLPEEFGNLGALRELGLHDNKLGSLPSSFSLLQSLSKLSLIYNNFTFVPEPLFQMKSLKELDLSNNFLPSPLPSDIESSLTEKGYLIGPQKAPEGGGGGGGAAKV